MRAVIRLIVDDGEFLEVHEHHARNIVCGFARLDGDRRSASSATSPRRSPACSTSTPRRRPRASCAPATRSTSRSLTFVDVPGFLPGTEQEWGGIIRHGAKLLYAYAEATVPKITVITRKAYGGAYDVMSSKHLRADFNFAWPTAEIAVMGPEGAVNIVYQPRDRRQRRAQKRARAADGGLHARASRTPTRRRARLHRRRDRAARDAPAADHGAAAAGRPSASPGPGASTATSRCERRPTKPVHLYQFTAPPPVSCGAGFAWDRGTLVGAGAASSSLGAAIATRSPSRTDHRDQSSCLFNAAAGSWHGRQRRIDYRSGAQFALAALPDRSAGRCWWALRAPLRRGHGRAARRAGARVCLGGRRSSPSTPPRAPPRGG